MLTKKFFLLVFILTFIPTMAFARKDPACIRACGNTLNACKNSWESDRQDCKKKCDFNCGFLPVDSAVRQCISYCEASCDADSSGIDRCLSDDRACTESCPDVP